MSGEVFVCIHCGRCVEFCPHNCLEMEEVTETMQVEVTS
ncbi:MAG: 4Fe-4S binding protein [Thermodesulfobacteriota bacterium]|nr:4Fe-4S binding protein [Thermodesulfobacteriota bacterium]